jgi:hypothetical protein
MHHLSTVILGVWSSIAFAPGTPSAHKKSYYCTLFFGAYRKRSGHVDNDTTDRPRSKLLPHDTGSPSCTSNKQCRQHNKIKKIHCRYFLTHQVVFATNGKHTPNRITQQENQNKSGIAEFCKTRIQKVET